MFAEPIDVERATQALKMRLPDRYPVFRQIPVPSRNPLGRELDDAPDFDIHNHIVVGELDRPGDDETLQRYVSALMSRPLDRSKPCGRSISERLPRGQRDGRPVPPRPADGTALARVLLELTDDEPDDDLAEAGGSTAPESPTGTSYRLPSLTDMVGPATGR